MIAQLPKSKQKKKKKIKPICYDFVDIEKFIKGHIPQ